jgi:hypothetical protein
MGGDVRAVKPAPSAACFYCNAAPGVVQTVPGVWPHVWACATCAASVPRRLEAFAARVEAVSVAPIRPLEHDDAATGHSPAPQGGDRDAPMPSV